MRSLFQPILNKGGGGFTLSRVDQSERVSDIVRENAELLRHYDRAIDHMRDRDLANRLDGSMRRARTELGKLREVILSGGIAGGTARDPHVELPPMPSGGDAGLTFELLDRERAFGRTLQEALEPLDNRLRVRAVIQNALAGSEDRLSTLREVTQRMRRPVDRRVDREVQAPTEDAASA
ncbi:hypothetical protein BH23BAC4_BH23BAC4_16870 [soil metagenome]